MDPALLTPEELLERAEIVIDPCGDVDCSHLRRAHVYIPRPKLEEGYRLNRLTPITACLFCTCPRYVERG